MCSLLIASWSHTQHNLSTQWTDYNFEQILRPLVSVEGEKTLYIVWGKSRVLVQTSTSVRCQLLVTAEKNVNYYCEVRRNTDILRRKINISIESELCLRYCNRTNNFCLILFVCLFVFVIVLIEMLRTFVNYHPKAAFFLQQVFLDAIK